MKAFQKGLAQYLLSLSTFKVKMVASAIAEEASSFSGLPKIGNSL